MAKGTDKAHRSTDLAWDDAAMALLRDGFAAGKSASAIARSMSEALGRAVSRNTVLGKLHRLGLRRIVTSEPESAPEPVIAPLPPEPEPLPAVMDLPFTPPAVVAPEPSEAQDQPGVPLFDIGLFQCRWPVSSYGAPFRFCGAPFDPANTYSWCPEHMALGVDQRSAARRQSDWERSQKLRIGKAKAA